MLKESLQKLNQVITIMEEIIIMEEIMIVVRDPKSFNSDFDCPKYENLKHKVESIIKKQWIFSWEENKKWGWTM